jgi:hypothetical protein
MACRRPCDAARLRLEIGDQFLVLDVEHHTLRQHDRNPNSVG